MYACRVYYSAASTEGLISCVRLRFLFQLIYVCYFQELKKSMLQQPVSNYFSIIFILTNCYSIVLLYLVWVLCKYNYVHTNMVWVLRMIYMSQQPVSNEFHFFYLLLIVLALKIKSTLLVETACFLYVLL